MNLAGELDSSGKDCFDCAAIQGITGDEGAGTLREKRRL